MTELISKHGANFKWVNAHGETPLHQAAHEDTAVFLIRRGADIHAATRSGDTPLHKCAERGQLQACRLLLELGADPRAKTRTGYTPRMTAKFLGEQEAFVLLSEMLKKTSAEKSQRVAASGDRPRAISPKGPKPDCCSTGELVREKGGSEVLARPRKETTLDLGASRLKKRKEYRTIENRWKKF